MTRLYFRYSDHCFQNLSSPFVFLSQEYRQFFVPLHLTSILHVSVILKSIYMAFVLGGARKRMFNSLKVNTQLENSSNYFNSWSTFNCFTNSSEKSRSVQFLEKCIQFYEKDWNEWTFLFFAWYIFW